MKRKIILCVLTVVVIFSIILWISSYNGNSLVRAQHEAVMKATGLSVRGALMQYGGFEWDFERDTIGKSIVTGYLKFANGPTYKIVFEKEKKYLILEDYRVVEARRVR